MTTETYFVAYQDILARLGEDITDIPLFGGTTLRIVFQSYESDILLSNPDPIMAEVLRVEFRNLSDSSVIFRSEGSSGPAFAGTEAAIVNEDVLSILSDADDIVPFVTEVAEGFALPVFTGRNEIDFGGGFDVFDGQGRARADVTLEAVDGVTRVTFGGSERFVRNLEKIDLADGAYMLDLTGESVDEVYRLYDAAFARTPDEDGLRFWVDAVENQGFALDALPEEFVVSEEFARLFGASPSDEEFIDALYNNVLRRGADADGFAFWLDEFQSGRQTRADMLEFFSESPENVERNADNLDVGVWVI